MHIRRLMIMLAATGLLVAACGDDEDDSNATPAPAATEAPAASEAPAATEAPAASEAPAATEAPSAEAATVMIANNATLGDYLVDAEGRTLYLFELDEGTTTACTGGCADNWPPIIAEAPAAGDGIDAAELGNADGIAPNQVTYHGHLLYYFAGDQAAGDTNGVGIPEWYAVSPAGEAIETG